MAKTTTTALGKWGEDYAVKFLIEKGFEIKARNFRSGRKEIDIIAYYNDILVFVEVKSRKHNHFGNPEEFVSEAQIERLNEAAEAYMYSHQWNGKIRFDIIAITATKELVHLEDAF